MVPVKIKICGLTSVEEAEYLNENQVDYAGFVLYYPKSKRHITMDKAIVIKSNLDANIKTVAVVVSPTIEQVKEIEKAGFDFIQIHGVLDEKVLDVIQIPIFRAFSAKEIEEKKESIEYTSDKVIGIVYDGDIPGSGIAFHWSNVKHIPKNQKLMMLAGGLCAENVINAIHTLDPEIVDVSSGVEKDAGIGKDRCKIKQFVQRVRGENRMSKETYYGEFGGQYVSESLMNTLKELDKAYEEAIRDKKFWEEFHYYMKEYVGRETPLYFAERLSEKYGTKLYLKREDLNHTGAHKINNVVGQILLAKRMGKSKVIAETGAGQHGVATATGAALFHMECTVYMGKEDMERQALNVLRMELLGAKVVCVTSGSNTLKDATNEAIRTWAKTAEDTFYIIGSAVGPYPYPKMVKEFQSVISKETKKQILEKEGRLPDAVVACVGGGSNSIGMFAEFIEEKEVELIGVEAAGLGIESGKHASAMALGKPGTLHGMRSYLLQNEDGNVQLAHSISAGLDYPGVGPEHAYLRDIKRANYVAITDDEAMAALMELCKMEGIIPAIESAHALAYAFQKAEKMKKEQILVICLSGRGDKDCHTILEYLQNQEAE